MSSIKWTLVDQAILPAGLLILAKQHLRIDGGYDDALIRNRIAAAINWFERITNVTVNPVTWVWSPDSTDFRDGQARVPVSPVQTFTVKDGNAVDISASYNVTTMSTHGVGIYALQGAFVDGMAVTIESGYEIWTAIDPGITDAVLRYTSHLYEHREILVPGAQVQTPGWMTDVISTYLMPRV